MNEYTKYQACWINPKGDIIPVTTKHINYIRDNPKEVGITKEDYIEIFKKFGEKFGWEGKARNELITNAMQRGWIRIRNKKNSGWSVETWIMNKKSQNYIYHWAKKVLGLEESYDIDYVNIHILSLMMKGKPQSMWNFQYTLNDIISGKIYEHFEDDEEEGYTILNGNKVRIKKFKGYQIGKHSSPFDYLVGELSEAGLARLLSNTRKNKNNFVILSASRRERSKKENKEKSIELFKELNRIKLGPYSIEGHWVETDRVTNKKMPVTEDSFFVVNTKYSLEVFREIILNLVIKYEQESAIFAFDDEIYELKQNNKLIFIGKNIELNTISKAYSVMKNKPNIPFIFEGMRQPMTLRGRELFTRIGLNYLHFGEDEGVYPKNSHLNK